MTTTDKKKQFDMVKNFFIFKSVSIYAAFGNSEIFGRSRTRSSGLDLVIYRGMRLLISGSSSAGKTSLIRTLKGLSSNQSLSVVGNSCKFEIFY